MCMFMSTFKNQASTAIFHSWLYRLQTFLQIPSFPTTQVDTRKLDEQVGCLAPFVFSTCSRRTPVSAAQSCSLADARPRDWLNLIIVLVSHTTQFDVDTISRWAVYCWNTEYAVVKLYLWPDIKSALSTRIPLRSEVFQSVWVALRVADI